MKRIVIETIPADQQRYSTCGDYWEADDEIHFRITQQPDEKWEMAVLVHEVIEYFLCRQRAILEPEITDYDLQWEQRYKRGENKAEEPGDELDAPYHKEHEFAKSIERQFADEIGIDWEQYDKNLIYLQHEDKSEG
jgi:hypothetical protein